MDAAPTLSWSALEHSHIGEKNQDWFWALGIIAVMSAVAAILFGNLLFALLILIGATTLGLTVNSSHREPVSVQYGVTPRGILVDDFLYSYKGLQAFFINESHPDKNVLIVDIQQPLQPHLIIELPTSVDRDALQDYLLDYLPEEELYESPAQRIAEMVGL